MPSEILGLIQVGKDADYELDTLKTPLATKFPWFTVKTVPTLENPKEAYDSGREQYHSTRILVMLEEEVQRARVDRLLGVTCHDIYVPGMNFVFGEARLPGRAGIISTYRLQARSSNESNVFHQRVLKEAIHELGHMVGLKHCPDEGCVMHFSERLADTDRKQSEFCQECKEEVEGIRVE
jgi:archaemetzincin